MPTSNACAIWANNSYRSLPTDYTASTTTSGGNAVFYLTDDGTASGKAVYTEVFLSTMQIVVPDSGGIYAAGAPTLSSDKKTLTVPVTKQTFNSIVILSNVNVIGTVSMNPAANGTPVNLMIEGVA